MGRQRASVALAPSTTSSSMPSTSILMNLTLGSFELVESHHLDLLAALAPIATPPKIAAAAVVDRRNFRAARAAPDRMRQGADIVELIEGDVAAQNLEDDTLRLECVDEAGGADELRHRKGVRTEIGADIERHVARRKALAKQIDSPSEYSPYSSKERPT